jgi:hypothetical protein
MEFLFKSLLSFTHFIHISSLLTDEGLLIDELYILLPVWFPRGSIFLPSIQRSFYQINVSKMIILSVGTVCKRHKQKIIHLIGKKDITDAMLP